ncbi:MAG: hypothetical protein M1815_004828 [Lichina confinis]|nr:MAG: hypothetical protein M1815_004828 [Lichina confinis]
MAEQRPKWRGYNYPSPRAVKVPYESPPAPTNPAVRGLPLYYAAAVISSVSMIRSFLWRNGGFSQFRGKKELEDLEYRYDPTVVPVQYQDNTPAQDHTNPDNSRTSSSKRTGGYYSVLEFHDAYKSGKVTPKAVVEALLPIIRRDVDAATQHATAFVQVQVDRAKEAAEASTQRYKEGKSLGVLDGVPVAVKDHIDVQGYPTYCGKADIHSDTSDYTSWCISKWEERGAIVIGKTNMHELGKGITSNNPNPNHGTPLNPHNPHYYPGGSSGGSAYAVSAGLIPIAHGSDGGGSVRIPANFCGIYGLKPSHGRVSIEPSANMSITTTVHGPIASNMTDLEVAYRVMAAPNPGDPVSAMFPPPRPTAGPRKKILGVYRPWLDRADAAVKEACQSALDHLVSAHDYTIVPIAIPLIHEGQMAHALTILNESSASHPDWTGLTSDNKILLSVAAKTPARDFLLAQKLRNLLMRHLAYLFTEHPGILIVTPTTPNAGYHIAGGKSELRYGSNDGNMTIRTMEYVWLANFTGIPALSAPIGYVDPVEGEGKIPVGLMAMGEWGSEDALIEWGFDAQAYLNLQLKGGRKMPENWVDVLEAAGPTDA